MVQKKLADKCVYHSKNLLALHRMKQKEISFSCMEDYHSQGALAPNLGPATPLDGYKRYSDSVSVVCVGLQPHLSRQRVSRAQICRVIPERL